MDKYKLNVHYIIKYRDECEKAERKREMATKSTWNRIFFFHHHQVVDRVFVVEINLAKCLLELIKSELDYVAKSQ